NSSTFRKLERFDPKQLGQRDSFNEVVYQDRNARDRADAIEVRDTRMPQLGRRSPLALNSLAVVRIGQRARIGHLERHQAVQFRVARFPDRSETPRADAIDKLEVLETASVFDRGRLMSGCE